MKNKIPPQIRGVIDFYNNIDAKILKLTGIDFSKQPDPPSWIKGNGIFEFLYRLLFQKWLLVAIFFYGVLQIYI